MSEKLFREPIDFSRQVNESVEENHNHLIELLKIIQAEDEAAPEGFSDLEKRVISRLKGKINE